MGVARPVARPVDDTTAGRRICSRLPGWEKGRGHRDCRVCMRARTKIALPPCTHPAAIVRVQVHKSKDKQPRTSAAAMSVPRVHVQVQVYV